VLGKGVGYYKAMSSAKKCLPLREKCVSSNDESACRGRAKEPPRGQASFDVISVQMGPELGAPGHMLGGADERYAPETMRGMSYKDEFDGRREEPDGWNDVMRSLPFSDEDSSGQVQPTETTAKGRSDCSQTERAGSTMASAGRGTTGKERALQKALGH
jgi:hypothetical protein